VSGTIDTSFTPHPPVSGVISTSFKQQVPLTGTIDTTSRAQGEVILGSLYTNDYKERNVNLGLLYLGVTHENILPITYLYAKSEKFNSLANYYVSNNAVSENKKLFNLSIDQTVRTLTPFELIYEYNNNIDVNKTLNNITLYNNEINRVNNMVALNVIDSIRTKPDFTEVKLYNNTNFEKTLALRYLYDKVEDNKVLGREYLYEKVINDKKLDGQLISLESNNDLTTVLNLGNIVTTKPTERGSVELGLLYEPSKIKKILEPYRLFEPKTKKTLDLGKISGDFIEKNINSLVETESKKPFGLVAEYDAKPIAVVNKLEESRKDFEQSKAEQVIIEDKPLVKQYISEKEIKDNSLHGDTIFDTGDYKKEKPGLDNERLR